jgi:hypothetical protein
MCGFINSRCRLKWRRRQVDASRIVNSPSVLLKCKELQKAAGQEPVCSLLSEWSTFFVGGGVELLTSEKRQIRL